MIKQVFALKKGQTEEDLQQDPIPGWKTLAATPSAGEPLGKHLWGKIPDITQPFRGSWQHPPHLYLHAGSEQPISELILHFHQAVQHVYEQSPEHTVTFCLIPVLRESGIVWKHLVNGFSVLIVHAEEEGASQHSN